MLPRLLGEDIQLKLSLDQSLWTVKVDPTQIDQVLMNLAVNACDAMPQGGKLVIETHNVELDGSWVTLPPDVPSGAFVMICFSDTGTGISKEAMPHILSHFSLPRIWEKEQAWVCQRHMGLSDKAEVLSRLTRENRVVRPSKCTYLASAEWHKWSLQKESIREQRQWPLRGFCLPRTMLS